VDNLEKKKGLIENVTNKYLNFTGQVSLVKIAMVLTIYQSELKEKQRTIVLTFKTAAKFNTPLFQRISNSRKVTPLSLINVKQTKHKAVINIVKQCTSNNLP